MSYDVRIIFDGLVAVGPPHQKGNDSERKGPLFAVMPFAMRKRSHKSIVDPTPDPFTPIFTSVHFPVIITDLKPYGRKADEYYPQQRADAGKYLWYPMRERMEFSFNRDGNPGRLTYERSKQKYKCEDSAPPELECKVFDPENEPQRAQVTLGNIDTVSDMREIWPQRSKLKKKMLAKHPPREVAAQVFVPRGKVSGGTEDYHYPNGQCTSYKPTQTANTVKKCAMQQIVVTVDDVTQLDIAMHSLDTGEELDPLSFKIERNADIRIINADPEAIRTVLTGISIIREQRQGADIDFENHYKLLRGSSGLHLPVPHPNPGDRFMLRPCYTTLVNGNG
jgi:hypothetical protein